MCSNTRSHVQLPESPNLSEEEEKQRWGRGTKGVYATEVLLKWKDTAWRKLATMAQPLPAPVRSSSSM